MNKQEIKNKMNDIISEQNIETLKDSLIKLMNDFSEGSNIAFDSILNELEKRLPEDKFIQLCEVL